MRSEPKLGKALGVFAFIESGNRKQLGARHDSLAATAMYANFKHEKWPP